MRQLRGGPPRQRAQFNLLESVIVDFQSRIVSELSKRDLEDSCKGLSYTGLKVGCKTFDSLAVSQEIRINRQITYCIQNCAVMRIITAIEFKLPGDRRRRIARFAFC